MDETCVIFGLSLMDYLTGAWRIERRISDRLLSTEGHFTGEANFTAKGHARLHYSENGILDMNQAQLRAERRYRWDFHPSGRAQVYFADGSAFHEVDIADNRAIARHLCPPDTYDVAYHFEDADHWRVSWRVVGPRKNYQMDSVFRRLHRVPLPVQCPDEPFPRY